MNHIQNTLKWFEKAIPSPTHANYIVQLSCLLEEVEELLRALDLPSQELADTVQDVRHGAYALDNAKEAEVLDAIADIYVTALGTGYMLGQDVEGAIQEVNRSNWSKFENGEPVFNEAGKIMKGKNYSPPDLKPFL